MLATALLSVGLFGGCNSGGTGEPVGWGLDCAGGRYAPMGITPSELSGHETPESAVSNFVNGPAGKSMPKEGWERADFVPTDSGTIPVTATLPPELGSVALPQQAFVHQDDGRIDRVAVLSALPGGWVVSAMHSCAA